MKIRAFQDRDLRSVLNVEDASFGRNAWPPECFEEYARHFPEFFLVAAVGQTIVGYSLASIRRGAAEVDSIAVRPKYRGRGIATALLQATLRKVRRSGANTVWLMVRSRNTAAKALYQNLGFVHTATVSGYYEDGSPAWRMKLRMSAKETLASR